METRVKEMQEEKCVWKVSLIIQGCTAFIQAEAMGG